MEDMARTEYPALLANLQPGQAVQTLNDRVKRINKINIEIADWLQERRRVEEQYVMGLRKLAQSRSPNSHSELGVFQSPWTSVVDAVERIAQSHHAFAERLEQDVEQSLRTYQQRPDYQNMHNISSNLGTMAKDLDDAQDKADKLNRKGGKASTQKIGAASSKLETASQQWESQAPFVFESLQALDESRVNHLRDVLTQYQTHEADQGQRTQDIAAQTLAMMLEISTEKEIQDFARNVGSSKAPAFRRTSTRQSSVAGTQLSADQPPPLPSVDTMNSTTSAAAPPSTRGSQTQPDDEVNDLASSQTDQPKGSKLRRLGTIFGGRRRQSVQGGFGQLSPGKTAGTPFGRLGSSHGRGVSPRASSTNLQESNRLASLAETPDTPTAADSTANEAAARSHEGTNGVGGTVNGTKAGDVSDVAPPPGPPPGQQSDKPRETPKDEEGFTVRSPMKDPISEAQREAAGEEADQLLKLNIQNKPVEEEDPEAKEAAMSSVANSLKMGPATRRTSTIRGRRDVRNTMYVPPPSAETSQNDLPIGTIAGSPPLATSPSFPRSPVLNNLASEASVAGTSDSQSVRSGHSLGNLVHAKHPEMTGPGLNSSVIETVSAVFEDGEVKSASIAGELAFVNNESDATSGKTHETIRINNFTNLERIGPNRIFVSNASPDQNDQFALDLSHISKASIGFSYRVFASESEPLALAKHAPLMIKPAWKSQDDKLGLLLQYHLNPSSQFTAPVTLHNVVFIATYEGKATGAQTKPSGTHLKDKHLVYWRLGDVTLTSDPQKIVCRVIGADGVCPTPGRIEARWEYTASGSELVGSGISVSRLDGKGKELESDPFADQSLAASGSSSGQTWVDVPVVRKLVGGKYEAK